MTKRTAVSNNLWNANADVYLSKVRAKSASSSWFISLRQLYTIIALKHSIQEHQ